MEKPDSNLLPSVKSNVLNRIECEKICPRSRYFYRCREYAVWSLWFLSVFVGSLAIAVSLFVVTHQQYALYEATHENILTFMVEVLPYLWIVLFGLMILVGVHNLRHTKRGYRYPLWQIVLSSVILSFAGGTALQIFGFGYVVDHALGEQMRMYVSQEKMEQRMWQAPAEGRLLGRQTLATITPTSTIIFADVSGAVWNVDVSELSTGELNLLREEELVKLIGQASNGEVQVFHSCGAFAWVFDKNTTRDDLSSTRQNFIERLKTHKDRASKYKNARIGTSTEPAGSLCDEIGIVKRMPEKSSD